MFFLTYFSEMFKMGLMFVVRFRSGVVFFVFLERKSEKFIRKEREGGHRTPCDFLRIKPWSRLPKNAK